MGGHCKTHFAGDIEKLKKLFEKLLEELDEFFKAKSKKDKENELADSMEVADALFDALVNYYRLNKKKVKSYKKRKPK